MVAIPRRKAMHPLDLSAADEHRKKWKGTVSDNIGGLLLSLQTWNQEQIIIQKIITDLISQLVSCAHTTAEYERQLSHHYSETLTACQRENGRMLQQCQEEIMKRGPTSGTGVDTRTVPLFRKNFVAYGVG